MCNFVGCGGDFGPFRARPTAKGVSQRGEEVGEHTYLLLLGNSVYPTFLLTMVIALLKRREGGKKRVNFELVPLIFI